MSGCVLIPWLLDWSCSGECFDESCNVGDENVHKQFELLVLGTFGYMVLRLRCSLIDEGTMIIFALKLLSVYFRVLKPRRM